MRRAARIVARPQPAGSRHSGRLRGRRREGGRLERRSADLRGRLTAQQPKQTSAFPPCGYNFRQAGGHYPRTGASRQNGGYRQPGAVGWPRRPPGDGGGRNLRLNRSHVSRKGTPHSCDHATPHLVLIAGLERALRLPRLLLRRLGRPHPLPPHRGRLQLRDVLVLGQARAQGEPGRPLERAERPTSTATSRSSPAARRSADAACLPDPVRAAERVRDRPQPEAGRCRRDRGPHALPAARAGQGRARARDGARGEPRHPRDDDRRDDRRRDRGDRELPPVLAVSSGRRRRRQPARVRRRARGDPRRADRGR